MSAAARQTEPASCFHCGLPVPRNADFRVEIDGAMRAMCCPGCSAVAELIRDGGMLEYYRQRESPAPRPDADAVDRIEAAVPWDDPELQRGFVREEGSLRIATLSVQGITCAACVWLIERQLLRVPGVVSAHVNLARHRAQVRFDPRLAKPSLLIGTIERLGYHASPYSSDREEEILASEQRASLRRLGVAGIGMAQVMMFAVALYAGDLEGMADRYRDLLRWVSWLVATIVLGYSARPILAAALRDLRARTIGMDVPVAIALVSAYTASVVATLGRGGEVYYDSICMFTFFLTLARHLELGVRARSTSRLRGLARSAASIARRTTPDGDELVAAALLKPGDAVRVAAGETIPADGTVTGGEGAVSEALLTGEQAPVHKQQGDFVLGGSQNLDGSLRVRVTRVGSDSAYSTILKLLDRAQSEKPAIARAADRFARIFVGSVLASAVVVAFAWWRIAPENAFWITLSVLIATCPCALSLATPAALAAATNALAANGFLVTHARSLEALAEVDHVLFDKTGTLTSGLPRLQSVLPLAPHTHPELIAMARVLEQGSAHPFARAIRAPALHNEGDIERCVGVYERDSSECALAPNQGVSGRIGKARLCFGGPDWVTSRSGVSLAPEQTALAGDPKLSWLLLADAARPLAWFGFGSELRDDARETLAALHAAGIETSIASGDPSLPGVARVAAELGISDARAGCTPEMKLARLESLQASGASVAAVGDGINDVPLLARAHVSIAMGDGADLARCSADSVVLGNRLRALPVAIAVARKTRRIIRQNLTWALAYNLGILPLAACGFVPPYAAAIGMSLSSLVVVTNALRVARVGDLR